MTNIKISICDRYDYTKDKEYNNSRVSSGWKLIEIPWAHEDIRTLVTTNGVSCSEFLDGHKVNTSWFCFHCLMLDFDNGIMTSTRLLQIQQAFSFNSYVFTSQNHMRATYDKSGQPKPVVEKLRVLIPLIIPIQNEDDRKIIKQIFVQNFGKAIDGSFMDRNRYFAHGRADSGIDSFTSDRGFLNYKDIPGYGKDQAPILQAESKGKAKYTSHEIDQISYHLDENARDETGKPMKMRDAKPGDRIFCPKCGDAPYRSNATHNATMFIAKNAMPHVYCSSCASRDLGKAGSGVYQLHPDDWYEYMILEKREYVFEDKRTGNTYGLEYDLETKEPIFRHLATKDNLYNFCKGVKIPIPLTLQRMDYGIRFNSDDVINFEKQQVNKYIPTELITLMPIPGEKHEMPYMIGKTLRHIVGDDEIMYNQFVKWLAYFIQYRKKVITTFLFQGTEGTGKGVTFNHILTPIIGARYCSDADQDRFGNQFNSFLTSYLLVLVNEVHMDDSERNRSAMEKIKQAITETSGIVERKGVEADKEEQVCTFLFATNRHHGIILSKGDRRFNVCPRQEKKLHDMPWYPGHEEWLAMVTSELPEFVRYLKTINVTTADVSRPINNEAKRKLQEMSTTTSEDFFVALKNGDITYLQENLVSEPMRLETYTQTAAILHSIKERGNATTEELCKLYNYMYRKDLSVASFGKLISMYVEEKQSIRVNGEPRKGYKISWKI